MCTFFSFVSDPSKPIAKRFLYFNWEQRQDFLKGKIKEESPDSHTSIGHFYGYSAVKEDSLNKYEYNPLTQKFIVDQINNKVDDSIEAEKWVKELDFKNVCPLLILKPIINPLSLPPRKPTKKDIENLKKWASVWASVWESVWDSVWDSVWTSVRDSVKDSVWDSVWTSVRGSVKDSVRDSVWDYVWASVRSSVWASVWAYLSSFFNIKYKFDYSPLLELYAHGFIPSFDGTTWRLHTGTKATIVYEWEK